MNKSVSIRDLSLSFGAVTVLKDLNLDIYDGEFLVLLGSSGCGKSTLLNCIAGLLEPTDGQIFIKDRNVTWEEPKDRGIGMVFQSYALYPQMTVEKNLSFGLKVAKVPQGEIDKRVARAAEILQITGIWNDFLFGVVFTRPEYYPMTVQLNNIVNSVQGVKEYNVNMAATMLTGAVPLIVYFVSGRLFVRGIAAGAVKG